MSTASNALQKVIQIVLSKMKNCVLCNIYIIVIMFHSVHRIEAKLVSNWEQTMLYT